jgi:phosphoserine phosphatase
MLGWGCEDMDVRLRLALAAGLPYRLVDPVGVEALEHDDHLRVRYYREKDLVASNSANFERMVNNIMRSMGWTEQQLLQACEEREISQLMWARGNEDT